MPQASRRRAARRTTSYSLDVTGGTDTKSVPNGNERLKTTHTVTIKGENQKNGLQKKTFRQSIKTVILKKREIKREKLPTAS